MVFFAKYKELFSKENNSLYFAKKTILCIFRGNSFFVFSEEIHSLYFPRKIISCIFQGRSFLVLFNEDHFLCFPRKIIPCIFKEKIGKKTVLVENNLKFHQHWKIHRNLTPIRKTNTSWAEPPSQLINFEFSKENHSLTPFVKGKSPFVFSKANHLQKYPAQLLKVRLYLNFSVKSS